MITTRIVEDIDDCQLLWRQMIPAESLFDLWEVRDCFHRHYNYRPYFVVTEDAGNSKALLALSYIEDHGYFGAFPGETYHGLTWLEQNRLLTDSQDNYRRLMEHCPQPFHLRYLKPNNHIPRDSTRIDEVGYLFHPGDFNCIFDQYLDTFSRKSLKRLKREIAAIESSEVTLRYDQPEDLDLIFSMNLQSFGTESYFADNRFLASFKDLTQLLGDRGWRRITTVLINGQVAAVDVGAEYRGVYTVLAGGTNPGNVGVAKVINFNHLQWACKQGYREVDFLCGDFGWKSRFHLTPRPLYQVGEPISVPNDAQPVTEFLENVM